MFAQIQDVSATELNDYLALTKDTPRLLDVREPWEFEIAHIKGSELVPINSIPDELPRFDPEQELIVICHHGIRSMQVCKYLASSGFSKLVNLRGGIDAWAREIDTQLPTY